MQPSKRTVYFAIKLYPLPIKIFEQSVHAFLLENSMSCARIAFRPHLENCKQYIFVSGFLLGREVGMLMDIDGLITTSTPVLCPFLVLTLICKHYLPLT